MLPEYALWPIIWTQDEPTIWQGEMDGRFVVELILLGRAYRYEEARWVVIGGFKGESPSFGYDVFGTVEEAKLRAGEFLVTFAGRGSHL